MSKVTRICFLVMGCLSFFFLSSLYAAEYYVEPKGGQSQNEADNGAAAWNDAKNIATPCSAGTSMIRAVAGDTVFFLPGTYQLGQSNNNQKGIGVLYPRNSGTSDKRIVFAAHQDKTAILNTNVSGNIISRAWGNRGQSYTTLSGFTISSTGDTRSASVGVGGGSRGTIIENCLFQGSSTPGANTDNISGVAFGATSNYAVVRNCTFLNYRDQKDNHNTSAIKTYYAHYLKVSNCVFVNSTVAIFNKQDSDNNIYENNFIYNSKEHVLVSVANVGNSDGGIIRNNVMVNASYAAIVLEQNNNNYTNNWTINNNTIYNARASQRCISINNAKGRYVYNNVIVADASEGEVRFVGGSTVDEMDHNLYFSPSLTIRKGTQYYRSLSSWQSSNELSASHDSGCGRTQKPGCGSKTGDPQFVPVNGARDTAGEFAFLQASPVRKAARKAADIGADVSRVGIISGESVTLSPPADFRPNN